MELENNILINILTRSSNRPYGFEKCYTSVKKQTYKNVRHIVSYDNEKDLKYLKNFDVDLIRVNKEELDKSLTDKEGNTVAPYNLYCNKLLDTVEDGWILFLDDDDNLYHNKVLKEIVSIIKKEDEDTLLIWQMRYPNGEILPSNKFIKNKKIAKYNIGSPCFIFHSKYKNKARWDSFKVSDYRFLVALEKHIPKKMFVKKVYIHINNFGALGNKKDIYFKKTKTPSIFFNKNLFWYFIPKKHYELFGIKIFQLNTYKNIFKKMKNKFKK